MRATAASQCSRARGVVAVGGTIHGRWLVLVLAIEKRHFDCYGRHARDGSIGCGDEELGTICELHQEFGARHGVVWHSDVDEIGVRLVGMGRIIFNGKIDFDTASTQ